MNGFYNVTGKESCISCNGSGTKTYYGDTPNHTCKFCHGSGHVSPKGCFITTAVSRILGKGDNCYELRTYRNFRDNWLAKTNKGQEKIEKYYSIAPEIVNKINKRDDRIDIYIFIWEKFLQKGLNLIELNKYEEAVQLYENMLKSIIKQLENKN